MKTYNLKSNKLFYNLNNDEIESFINNTNSTMKTYDKNTTIIHEGDIINNIYVIIKGEIVIYKLDENGFKNIISKISDNDYFGPALAISSEPSPSYIESLHECIILHIPINNINTNTKESIKVYENILNLLAHKNLELNKKIYILGIKNLEERIITFLKMQHSNHGEEFILKYTKQQMAEYLFVDRSTLSRELKRLKNKGTLDYNKNIYKILKL